MPKDYYIILGVASHASESEIRAAYRRQAKQLHPDASGAGSEPFIELQEAYAVLSDPQRRRAYDEMLMRERNRRRAYLERFAEPLRSRPRYAEPLVPGRNRFVEEVSLSGSFRSAMPYVGEILDYLRQNFSGARRPKSGRMRQITLDIPITPEEAARGGSIRIHVPVEQPCPICWGSGRVGLFGCLRCDGSGRLIIETPVDVSFPAFRGTYHVEGDLTGLGIDHAYLSIRLFAG